MTLQDLFAFGIMSILLFSEIMEVESFFVDEGHIMHPQCENVRISFY